MQVGMRQFSAETVMRVMEESSNPSTTRGELARLLCELDHWYDSKGRPAVSSARKALVKMSHKAGFELPQVRPGVPELVNEVTPPAGLDGLSKMRARLSDVGEITLEVASNRHQRRSWDAMMKAWHPQGFKRPPGGQIRYWIGSSVHGVIGGIGFSAASWHQKARDEWIGWDADMRAANLSAVICNHRFLLIPRVYGLASEVLQHACKRVAADWEASYSVSPVLAYTYVEQCYRGSSYEAAGWSRCSRLSSGQAQRRAQPGTRKSVWMKPLSDNWQERLCEVKRRAIVKPKAVYLSEDAHWAEREYARWAEREYARSSHPDGRIRERIVKIGKAWVDHLGESIPVIFPSRSDRKAVYRLLSNEQVSMEHILEPHQASTAERCVSESVVLAIQDTTALNYHGLSDTEGLVGIGGRGAGAKGILAHFGLAINEVGRPLGVYALDAGFRKVDKKANECDEGTKKESERWLTGLSRAHELSEACPDTRVITVCDREADLWSMLRQAVASGDSLLVRSNGARKRKVILQDGTTEKLPLHLSKQPVIAHKTIQIEACGGKRKRKARKARLDLRACRVTLGAPVLAKDQTPTQMLAVSVDEIHAPRGEKPLHWLLLTTEGEASAEQARKVVRWYELRWHIETWFSVLKNGTRIATRQFDHADDLRKCLVFDATTACYIHDLNYMARNNPQVPARQVVGDEQVECLYAYLHFRGIRGSRGPPNYNPNIRTFVIDLASIAGFESRKSQPLPGTRKLWKAYGLFIPALIYHRGIHAEKTSN